MPLIERRHLPPQTGTGLTVRRGQLLRITDPEGEQVSDLTAFALDDVGEWMSSGRTIDYANTIYVTVGHTLYSNWSRPMWTIIEDTVGRREPVRRAGALRRLAGRDPHDAQRVHERRCRSVW